MKFISLLMISQFITEARMRMIIGVHETVVVVAINMLLLLMLLIRQLRRISIIVVVVAAVVVYAMIRAGIVIADAVVIVRLSYLTQTFIVQHKLSHEAKIWIYLGPTLFDQIVSVL